MNKGDFAIPRLPATQCKILLFVISSQVRSTGLCHLSAIPTILTAKLGALRIAAGVGDVRIIVDASSAVWPKYLCSQRCGKQIGYRISLLRLTPPPLKQLFFLQRIYSYLWSLRNALEHPCFCSHHRTGPHLYFAHCPDGNCSASRSRRAHPRQTRHGRYHPS